MCALKIIKHNSGNDQNLINAGYLKTNHKKEILSAPSTTQYQGVLSNLVVQLHKSNFEEILSRRAALITKYPNEADVHVILGIASIKSNRPEQAKIDFKAALEIDPQNIDALKNLANVLQETHSYEGAMHYYQLASSINNNDADLHYNIGKLNSTLGNTKNAIKNLQRTITIDDSYFFAFCALGELYLQERMLPEAEVHLRDAIALAPNSALALFALAKVLNAKNENVESDLRAQHALSASSCTAALVYDFGVFLFNEGDFKRAKDYFEKALEFDVDHRLSKIDLCSTLVMLREHKAAKKIAKELLIEDPNLVQVLNALGLCYESENRFDRAEELYKRCIELDEKYLSAHTNLAVMYSQEGKSELSKVHYRKVIQLSPEHTESFRQACDALGNQIPENLILDYENKIELQKLPLIDLARAHFGLAAYYKAIGNSAKYVKNLELGNAARKSYFGIEYTQIERDFTILKSAFEKVRTVSNLPSEARQNIPIFVVGMPRSGTTLIEQILSSHSKVSGAGELDFVRDSFKQMAIGEKAVNQTNLQFARNEYLGAVKSLGHHNRYVIDKMPHNFYYIGVIAKAFPEAKIIFVKRDKRAVCWSNYATYFVTEGLYYSYDLNNCLNYYDLHEDLMQYWKMYFDNRILTVDYDALTNAPDKIIKKMLLDTGLDLEPACFKPELNKNRVLTASSSQVRRPIYRNSSNKYSEYREFIEEISPNFFA